MNESERLGLAKMRDAWIAGGSAADLASPEWEMIAASLPKAERERMLLIVAGQALEIDFRPAAPKTLVRRPALPQLALAILPDRLRPLFRAALRQAQDPRGRTRVALLVASRGFVAHPLDWMPAASDVAAPPVYAPWVDWLAQTSGASGPSLVELTAENWGDFYPAARRIALADIRRSDPERARQLLEAKAGAEAAEARLILIELLRVNLSAADLPYLQSLAADRSAKVQHLAASLMARLGHGTADDESSSEAAELAGFIEPGKAGLLRRATVYKPRELKSHAQLQRRARLFESCRLIDLAAKLGTGEEGLVAGWQLGGKDAVDASFASMVNASASDVVLAQLAGRLLDAGDLRALLQLETRLDDRWRRRFIEAVLAGGSVGLPLLDAMTDIPAGTFGRDELIGSRLYKEVRAGMADNDLAKRVVPDLSAFGTLATAEAAAAIAADLAAAGLDPVNPSLALLRLNAVLDDQQDLRRTV